jgi:NAD(P)-dependent dehydrogenase (short-subunit alcohol dehydrogenase family)
MARGDVDRAPFLSASTARMIAPGISGAAAFLASAAADFIAGVTLPVDGGYSIC